MSVTRDATSGWYVPASSAEWTELLNGTGLSNPHSAWGLQDASGSFLDSISTDDMSALGGPPSYQQLLSGWSRKAMECPVDSGVYYAATAATYASSVLLLGYVAVTNTPAAVRTIAYAAGYKLNWTTGAKYDFARSGDATDAVGTATPGTTMHPVLIKVDRTNNIAKCYTDQETLTPVASFLAATNGVSFGGVVSSAPVAYYLFGALWTGSSAEISDGQAATLLDVLQNGPQIEAAPEAPTAQTTLSALSGSMSYKLVAAIEGCKYLLCESHPDSVLDAWSGTDWSTALPGLFVDMQNKQQIDPWSPFGSGGTCKLRVLDTDNSDTFGIFVNKRITGAETELVEEAGRDDATLTVAATTGFTSSGEIHIGTECVGYASITGDEFTSCTRGKYSPFGTAASGSGGSHFGNVHRIGDDVNHVQTRPVVSQLPRHWLGKRVGVWMHTWDDATETMNSRANAQLVYAGRIVGISDDPNDFCTVIDLEHVLNEVRDAVVGKDMWAGDLAEGMDLRETRYFAFADYKNGTKATANALRVVAAGTASGANQMDAGRYTASLLCEKINTWLAAEHKAGRLWGYYTWDSPVSTNDGIRTTCYNMISDASHYDTRWTFVLPAEVSTFLGLDTDVPGVAGQTATIEQDGISSVPTTYPSRFAPYKTMVYKPGNSVGMDTDLSGNVTTYMIENDRGTFTDQFSSMPEAFRGIAQDSTLEWGVFILDESITVVGSFDNSTGVLTKVFVAPLQFTADNSSNATAFFGRRCDDTSKGPVSIRQVFLMEGRLDELLYTLFFSTGTAGYNHSTYDTLRYGLALGLPGELLGDNFTDSVRVVPGSDAPLMVVIEEPTKLIDLLSADFVLRRCYTCWFDEHIILRQWLTPTRDLASFTFTEDNKAAPPSQQQNHRVASTERSDFARPIVKIDYCRDFSVGRNDQYLRSFQLEDQTAVDDAGGNLKPYTIKARNTYAVSTNSGLALEATIKQFLAFHPCVSRPQRSITRSMASTAFETINVGSVVTVTDAFARDPVTGERGITSRPATVVAHSWSLGGPTPQGGRPRDIAGSVELMFLDAHRGELYNPACDVDETQNSAGFSAGYNNATKTLTCHQNRYSQTGDRDTFAFNTGDKVLILERDPATPSSVNSWERTIASVSSNDIVLTSTLSSPAWDAAKLYRIVPQKWSQVQTTQQEASFQADVTDLLVEDDEPPFHYSNTEDGLGFVTNDDASIETAPEYIPELSYGDGRPLDVGHDRALAKNFNAYIDYKSGHNTPLIWNTAAVSGLVGTTPSGDGWITMYAGLRFFGREMCTATVTRTLTVAPLWRSRTGGSAWLRVTLSRVIPQAPPGVDVSLYSVSAFQNPAYANAFSQSTEWTTSSTTWQVGADATLSLGVSDVFYGYMWLIVEGAGDAESYGLVKCIEGPRTGS